MSSAKCGYALAKALLGMADYRWTMLYIHVQTRTLLVQVYCTPCWCITDETPLCVYVILTTLQSATKAGGNGDTIVYKEEMSSESSVVILTGSPARHLGQSITDRLRA